MSPQSIEINDDERAIVQAESTELSPLEIAQIQTRSDLAGLKSQLEKVSPNGELLKALKKEVSTNTPAFGDVEKPAVPQPIPPEVQNVINLSEGQSYFYLMSRIIALGYVPSIEWVKNFKNDAKGTKVALKGATIHTTPLYFTKFDPESKVMNGALHKQLRDFMNDKTTVAGLDDERRALKEALAKLANIPGKGELIVELNNRNDILNRIDTLRNSGEAQAAKDLLKTYPGVAKTTWTDILKMVGHITVDIIRRKPLDAVKHAGEFVERAFVKEETSDFREANNKALEDLRKLDATFDAKLAKVDEARVALAADPENKNLLKNLQKVLADYNKDVKPLEKLGLQSLAGMDSKTLAKAAKESKWANSIVAANQEHFKYVQGGVDFVSKNKIASGAYKGFMGVGMVSLLINGATGARPGEQSMWDLAKEGKWSDLAKQSGGRVVDTAVGFVPILGGIHEAFMLGKAQGYTPDFIIKGIKDTTGFDIDKYDQELLGGKMDDDERKFREMFLLTGFLGAGGKVVKYGAKGFVEAAQVAGLASKAYKAGGLAVKTSNFVRGGTLIAGLGMSMVSVVHDLGDEKDIPYVPFI